MDVLSFLAFHAEFWNMCVLDINCLEELLKLAFDIAKVHAKRVFSHVYYPIHPILDKDIEEGVNIPSFIANGAEAHFWNSFFFFQDAFDSEFRVPLVGICG